jgi:hypothetical protein
MICLDSGQAVDLSKATEQPNWDSLITMDLLILGSEDGIIRVFMRPREFGTPTMHALNTAFEEEVYNKVRVVLM